MHRQHRRFYAMLVCALLLAAATAPVRAEDGSIPAGGEICTQGQCFSIQVSFPPKGGAVSGSLSGTGSNGECALNSTGVIKGTFAGGDGGAISGTVDWTMVAVCPNGTSTNTWPGTWQGTVSAAGTGSGSGSVGGAAATWTISFSAEDFARAGTPITKEYFKATYGIDVLDGTAKWTDKQLQTLDEIIRALPADFWKKTKLTTIVRDKADIENGKENPNTFAWYYAPDRMIKIFDKANTPYDFSNDPNGDKEFKGTLVHEMTHAYQAYKDYKTTLTDNEMLTSTLTGSYLEGTRDKKADFRTGWAWNATKQQWQFLGKGAENKLVTQYAGTDPFEDLSESLMFYMTEPEKLAAQSPNRYSYIKDKLMGGKEVGWDY